MFRKGAAHNLENVLVAVVSSRRKQRRGPFADGRTRRGGDVLKTFAVIVTEHAVGQQRGEVGFTRAKVEIQPAIVVEVAEI